MLGEAAKFIENTLANFVPLLLDFMARMLRLGNVSARIKKILVKLRKPIDDLMEKIMAFIRKKLRKFSKKKPKKGEGDDIKKENKKDGKPEKLTQKDKAEHRKMAKEIAKKLEEPLTKKTPFEEAYKLKKKEAKALEDQYQRKLKKGINIDIKFKNASVDKKDGDIDFVIVIAPNNTSQSGSVDVVARLNEQEVVKEVNDASVDAESSFPSSALPTWAATFAVPGTPIKIEKGNKKGEDLTFRKILGKKGLNEFERKVTLALTNTVNELNSDFLKDQGITKTELNNQIKNVAEKVMTYLTDKSLMFITPTGIPRDVSQKKKGTKYNFVKVNTQLRKLGASKSKSLYAKIVENGDGVLYSILRDALKAEDIEFQVHHAHPMYLGGEHIVDNLLTLFGYAGRPFEPHGMLHELIDEMDIKKFLNTNYPTMTLDNTLLSKHFDSEKLKILIGTLKTDGTITYKETNLKLKK